VSVIMQISYKRAFRSL